MPIKEKLKEIQAVCDISKGYQAARKMLKQVVEQKKAYVPFLAIWMTDLVFYMEGEPGVDPAIGDLPMNVSLRKKECGVISQYIASRHVYYPFYPIATMQEYLSKARKKTTADDANDNYKRSLELEPRARPNQ